MSAEAIARVVRDIRENRYVLPEMIVPLDASVWRESLPHVVAQAPVIDSTAVYVQLTDGRSVDLYADFEIHPVWPQHVVAYQNQFGNVMVTFGMMDAPATALPNGTGQWETDNEIDWSRVEHVLSGWVFFGGIGRGQPVRTTGPISQLDVAIYPGGEVADIHWTQLMLGEQVNHELWTNQMMVWLQTITLAGCRNVELAVPTRPRAQRRQLERLGVTPSEIVIRRIGKTYRGKRGEPSNSEVPQSFVRGHFARYGPEYDRELLFGRYAGKFWIPAHARGTLERPGRDVDYLVAP